ncbi:PstS family phosphate ABC transporter substrate-binding protein [Sulfurospirillum arcachonense]|uniref:PstS family phosphate ABC transporter substrate-binding protein n=1 Tax=Sulfurospirillum arcachonense TaxID=57666 RepID=UPI000468FCC9|nr:PstS family phosphate ABC transporter substrate-binding protein [Sulfurospirillum arcachonense]
MSLLRKVAVTTTALIIAASAAQARDQIKIVGSSTVYPFSSYVAEELGATTSFPTPVVESTGSGGGMKLFCAGNGMNTPDITNASRAMKVKEWNLCQKNGVTDIAGSMVGYDGIAFAQSNKNGAASFTRKQLLLAVAAKVPVNGKLVDNPYKKWSDIDASLPNREIIIYGPPTSSGTRDAFEELVMEKMSKKMPGYGKKKYHTIRQDGVYIPSGENDNLIVQKLERNKAAFGIFGYSFLAENADKIDAAKIDGKKPTPLTIADASYPVSRSLYFYVKKSHLDKVKAMKPYLKMFMSDNMISSDGVLKTIGLIPMAKDLKQEIQASVGKLTPLTLDMVKARKIH